MNPHTPAFVPGHSRQKSQQSHVRSRVTLFGSNTSTASGSQSQSAPYSTRQPDLVSPTSRRAALPLLQKLEDLEIQENSESSKLLAPYRQSVDTATNPRTMPIGSLVSHHEPPRWGVVKVSNIPYSITKQEIFQFLGRKANLITADQGCPIHIIMERSTAKTMDCYAEFQSVRDAHDTVSYINRVHENGRSPRLGNRHVDVELSDQNALLRDLFPRAKCVIWKGGAPSLQVNNDSYCSGFAGLFTSEEIELAIRHAEVPQRSPFCDKCPQRTYESTISTLHKFPWYATEMYTVYHRNRLFELTNRHIKCLVERMQKTNTVGLDQKLLQDLLHAGLKCPAFNDRQKYTLCMHSEISSEINKMPESRRWFPFDTLARMPNYHEDIHDYFAGLISYGTLPELDDMLENMGLVNKFPKYILNLRSPYGCVWFEWPELSNMTWKTAVNREMIILSSLVFNGWFHHDENALKSRRVSVESSFSLAPGDRRNLSISIPHGSEMIQADPETSTTPFRRASESGGIGGVASFHNARGPWNQAILLNAPVRARPAYRGHRNTQSSPMCLPSPTRNPWAQQGFS